MKKILVKLVIAILLILTAYFCFIYFVPYSEGVRSGELVKFTRKGFVIKTWEGELSQGVSEEQRFSFSVEPKEKKVIEDLNKYQGSYVKLTYFERYKPFFWLGDTKHFIIKVEKDTLRNRNSFFKKDNP